MAYDLFSQFQKAGDDIPGIPATKIDQLVLLASSRAWIFTASALAGTLALLLGLVRASPSPILVLLGGFLLVTGLLFLIICFRQTGRSDGLVMKRSGDTRQVCGRTTKHS